MNISKISAYAAPSFSAQTRISAPENLLSKDDINRFVEMGKKYKTPQDIIEINISDIHPSENNPNVQVYTCTKIMKGKSPKGEYCDKSQMAVPYIKNGQKIENNSPKNYLSKVFSRLISG